MQVNGVTSYGTTGAGVQSTSPFGSTQFMQMLLAQLKHQNPMEPLKDSEMMAQFTQLNSLQELQSIKQMMAQFTAQNQTSTAADLIGKVITAAGEEDTTIEGRVEGFTYVSGQLYLLVGEYAVPLAAVLEVKEAAAEAPEGEEPPAVPEVEEETA
ncbi:MAG TPA: flagellar hook capping FlgD N-terminal domain-containing protein [Anaerolineaceae bacterium]|nr:flagellar hook capping FlgD N-terminal domain-containing protein [Anaerolineaceae bacterium]